MIPLRIPRLLFVLMVISAFLALLEGIFQRLGIPRHLVVVLTGFVAGCLVFLLAYRGGGILRFCGRGLVDEPARRARIRTVLFDVGVIEERRTRDCGDRRVRRQAPEGPMIEKRRGPERRQGGLPEGKSLMYVSVVESARFIAFTVKDGRSHRAFVSTRMVDSFSMEGLRGVLAHEYGHVLNRHPLKQASILGGLATVKMSVGVPLGAVVLVLLAYLFMLRKWEFAADAAAVDCTSASDLLAAFDEYHVLEGEKEMSRLSEFFSGHPSFHRRVAAIQGSLPPVPSEGVQID